MNDIPVLTELTHRFDEALRTAPGRRPKLARPLVIGLAAAILAGSAFTAGTLVSSRQVNANIPLPITDGKLMISYEQVLEDRQAVEDQITAAGIDIAIREVPASPSLVGHVRWSMGVSRDDPDIDRPFEPLVVPTCPDERVCWPWLPQGTDAITDRGELRPPQGYEAGLLVPLGYDGETEIHIGRPAADDEPYRMSASPLGPDEPLACRPVLLAPVAEVRQMLTDVDVPEVGWQLHGDLPPEQAEQLDTDGLTGIDNLDAAADLVVVDVAYLSNHGLLFWVSRPAQTPEEEQAAAEHANRRYQSAGCSESAAPQTTTGTAAEELR